MNLHNNYNPTDEFYRLLVASYDHFNDCLFDAHLPRCMITLQRQRNTMGYFSAERWCRTGGHKAHEIALNPAYFANHRIIDVLQTLVHEQCHLWQHVYGHNKSRSGYHNREWAGKMQAVGLVASNTGAPGGRQTGQTMSDYPSPRGKFLTACESLIQSGFSFPWVDTEPAITESCQPRLPHSPHQESSEIALEVLVKLMAPVASLIPELKIEHTESRLKKRLSKSKYSCPDCKNNIWGKPGLNVICGDCDSSFIIVG